MDQKKREEHLSFRIELVEKMSTLATAAFGLVAALAWNDAIQSLFTRLFGSASGIVAKFIYASIVTLVIVIVTSRLSRLAQRLKGEKEELCAEEIPPFCPTTPCVPTEPPHKKISSL